MAKLTFYIKVMCAGFIFFALCVLLLIVWFVTLGHGRVSYWYAHTMTTLVAPIFGVKIVIDGYENVFAKGPAIIVGNHQSNFDVVVHGRVYPPYCVAIGKKEIKWIPLFGWLFWLTGNILLDRKHKQRAWAGIEAATQALNVKKQWIYIFPEGTRSHKHEMGPFKNGAFAMAIAAQAPIVPVVCSPTLSVFDTRKGITKPAVVTLKVLKPIETKGLTDRDVESLRDRVRELMIETFSGLETKILE